MELDVSIHKGSSDKPVVIFIHGLGMDRNFWLDPFETKVLGKNVPMKVFAAVQPKSIYLHKCPHGPGEIKKSGITIGDIPKKINNLWSALRDRGFNLVCWSQRRPVGPISAAVEELEEIIELTARIFPQNNVSLLCHSRGGLIARKFMEENLRGIRALITLSTPHKGSSLSLIGKHLSPLSSFLKGLLPMQTHGTVSDVIKRMTDLIEGAALKELMPGSDFFKNLRDVPVKGIKYLSFGGSKTELVTVYKWKKKEDIMYPKPLLSIPDSLIKILPASILPDELKPGKGDFMVTTASSVLPWASSHYDLHANHISITWHRRVISDVVEVLEKISPASSTN